MIKALMICLSVLAVPAFAKNAVYNGITEIEAESVSQPTIDMIISQAKSSHWRTLKVEGDYSFKRAIWLTANSNAIFVYGYQPDMDDINQLKKVLGHNVNSKFNEIPQLGVNGAGN